MHRRSNPPLGENLSGYRDGDAPLRGCVSVFFSFFTFHIARGNEKLPKQGRISFRYRKEQGHGTENTTL